MALILPNENMKKETSNDFVTARSVATFVRQFNCRTNVWAVELPDIK
jgi:hypothetical protein